jgi:cephalosporin hydroxylase
MAQSIYRRFFAPRVEAWFYRDLIQKAGNFSHVTWLGTPVWQNVLDLWVMQETVAEVRPALLIECGTKSGASALFFAHIFDLMGQGSVVTIDVERLHGIIHPRIQFLLGNSLSPTIVETVRRLPASARGPVMVTLDSDHRESHVRAELAAYAPLVTPGSFILVQDGVIDTQPRFAGGRPSPLAAIEDFMRTATDFEVDEERARKFLISHHAKGWLRRKPTTADMVNDPARKPDLPKE